MILEAPRDIFFLFHHGGMEWTVDGNGTSLASVAVFECFSVPGCENVMRRFIETKRDLLSFVDSIF